MLCMIVAIFNAILNLVANGAVEQEWWWMSTDAENESNSWILYFVLAVSLQGLYVHGVG